MAVLDFFVNILSTPAILVGLLALVGLALQKKPIEEIVMGTIKTIVGFLVLSAGAAYLQSGSLLAFGELFNYAFNMQGVVPNNEAVVSMALTQFGQASAIIMCIGMILNIVLARFSRMHYIFLTGHHTLYMACMLAVVLSIGGLEGWSLYIAGGCVLALIMVISPAYCQPTFRKVTGSDGVALGHFGGIGSEVVNLAFLAGGLFLLHKRLFSWHAPVGMLGALMLMSLVFWNGSGSDSNGSPLFHLLSGATMLGAFFIVTDPVSSATSPRGRLIFGAGVGVLVYVIRAWGGYPDGVAFGVLLMNLAAPTIDYYTRPRTYGHRKAERGFKLGE